MTRDDVVLFRSLLKENLGEAAYCFRHMYSLPRATSFKFQYMYMSTGTHRDTYLEQQQTEKLETEARDVDRIRSVRMLSMVAFWGGLKGQ